MPMTRDKKAVLLAELEENLQSATAAVFVNYQGTKVKDLEALRTKLHEQGIRMRVVKNTILDLAARRYQFDLDAQMLTRPLAFISSTGDEVTPAKIIKEVRKEVPTLEVAGGLLNGRLLSATEMMRLADLPGRDELRAQLVGVLAAPLTGLVRTLQAPLANLVSVLKQYETSKQA